MGLFDRLSRGIFKKQRSADQQMADVMRLDVYMSYPPGAGQGSAGVVRVPLSHDDPTLIAVLIALWYSRVLSPHDETSPLLFEVVGDLAIANVRDQDHTRFPFPELSAASDGLASQAGRQRIWPWTLLESPDSLESPKVYKATLSMSLDDPDGYAIDLDMPAGQETVLVPSSALIAISAYSQSVDEQHCYELALLLWQINEYYKSLGELASGQESLAIKSTMTAIRSGELTIP